MDPPPADNPPGLVGLDTPFPLSLALAPLAGDLNLWRGGERT